MLSFTLSGKHMTYAYTLLKHITIIDIIIFMHSYNERIQLLMFIIDLCLFGSPIGVTKLILFQKYPYVLQKLILVLRILYLYYEVYTCLVDLILVSQSLFLYFGSYTYITEHILVLRDLFLCEGTRRFILVHISRRAHICTYIRFIYLCRNTYTRTCPYHRHILIKSLVGVIELQCVRRYP